jgi:hypothetical protein
MLYAGVVEPEDTERLNRSARKGVGVRIPPPALSSARPSPEPPREGWSRGLSAATDARVARMAAAKRGRPNWAKGRTAAADARVARNAEIRRGKKRGPYQTRTGSERKALLATFDPSEKPACLPDWAVADYSYLLGLYLGDGCIVERQNRLEITLDARYPAIIESASRAVASLHPRQRVAVRKHGNARVVAAYAWEWRLLFPQHGPGRKHTRRIQLTDWQNEILKRHPVDFLRGCLESDGSRNRRVVNGKNYLLRVHKSVHGHPADL